MRHLKRLLSTSPGKTKVNRVMPGVASSNHLANKISFPEPSFKTRVTWGLVAGHSSQDLASMMLPKKTEILRLPPEPKKVISLLSEDSASLSTMPSPVKSSVDCGDYNFGRGEEVGMWGEKLAFEYIIPALLIRALPVVRITRSSIRRNQLIFEVQPRRRSDGSVWPEVRLFSRHDVVWVLLPGLDQRN